jgi:hypothetical protein
MGPLTVPMVRSEEPELQVVKSYGVRPGERERESTPRAHTQRVSMCTHQQQTVCVPPLDPAPDSSWGSDTSRRGSAGLVDR